MKKTRRFFIALLMAFSVIAGNAQTTYTVIEKIHYRINGDYAIAKVYATFDYETLTLIPEIIEGPLSLLESVEINGKNYPVKVIDANGFVGQTQITSLDLKKVTTIGASAFSGCTGLTSADLSNVTSIGDYAFLGCSSLKSLMISQTTIGTAAFSGAAVETLTFAEGLTEIPALASLFGSNLKNVVLPSSASSIGASAFSGCTGLASVDLSNVVSVGASAFSGCTGLKSIDLSNVVSIGASAFKGCTGFTSINLSNVTSVGASAFENCGNLREEKGLTKVVWSESLTELPASVFSGCEMLNTITNLDKATTIGEYAFYGCSLLSGELEFSSNLKSVGYRSFLGTDLKSVVMKSSPALDETAFNKAVSKNLKIEDKVDFLNVVDNTFNNITYERTFSSGKFATLVLPFVPDQVLSGDLEVFELKEARVNECLVFGQVAASKFCPGTPYLVKATKDIDVLTAKNAEVKSGEAAATTIGDWTMNGTYIRKVLDASDIVSDNRRYYYLTSVDNQDKFLYAEGKLGVSAFRTYVNGPEMPESAGVRMMVRGLGGEETAIGVVELEDSLAPAREAYYDLNGCRVLNPVEGNMYIVNGKKIVF